MDADMSIEAMMSAIKEQIQTNAEFRSQVATAITHGEASLWEDLLVRAVQLVHGIKVVIRAGMTTADWLMRIFG